MAGLLKLHENPWVFCRGCENGCVWVIRGFAGFPGLASSGSLTPRPSAPPSAEARCTGKLWRIAWKTVKVNLRITRRFLTKNTWEVRLSTCRWRSASWPLVVTSLFCSGISPHAGWITGDRCRWMRPLLCHCKKEGKVILLRNLRIDVKTSEMKDSFWIRIFYPVSCVSRPMILVPTVVWRWSFPEPSPRSEWFRQCRCSRSSGQKSDRTLTSNWNR